MEEVCMLREMSFGEFLRFRTKILRSCSRLLQSDLNDVLPTPDTEHTSKDTKIISWKSLLLHQAWSSRTSGPHRTELRRTTVLYGSAAHIRSSADEHYQSLHRIWRCAQFIDLMKVWNLDRLGQLRTNSLKFQFCSTTEHIILVKPDMYRKKKRCPEQRLWTVLCRMFPVWIILGVTQDLPSTNNIVTSIFSAFKHPCVFARLCAADCWILSPFSVCIHVFTFKNTQCIPSFSDPCMSARLYTAKYWLLAPSMYTLIHHTRTWYAISLLSTPPTHLPDFVLRNALWFLPFPSILLVLAYLHSVFHVVTFSTPCMSSRLPLVKCWPVLFPKLPQCVCTARCCALFVFLHGVNTYNIAHSPHSYPFFLYDNLIILQLRRSSSSTATLYLNISIKYPNTTHSSHGVYVTNCDSLSLKLYCPFFSSISIRSLQDGRGDHCVSASGGYWLYHTAGTIPLYPILLPHDEGI